jgi:pimeloyl-ACP methyl ester carboxylesterase
MARIDRAAGRRRLDLLDGYADRISDFEVELVDGVGHWIVEQRPDLVLDRLRAFLRAET